MPDLVPSKFELRCGGLRWEGWKSFTVKQSLDQAAHSFSMETTDRLLEKIGKWNVEGGSEIEVLIDGARVFSGYVTKYGVSISSSDHGITIEGASKAIDAVECSHLGPYFWKNTTPEAIIAAVLEPFGFSAVFDKPMKPIGKTGFKVEVEKTPFEIVKQLAERDGLTVITDLDGNFRLFDGKNAPDAGAIVRGRYTAISADHDFSQAFSEIIVKGQQNSRGKPDKADFDSKQRTEKRIDNRAVFGNRTNPLGIRYRPIVYVRNGEEDAQKAFAEFVRSRFTGDVITASATVKSHLNPKGAIWQAGQEVYVEEELLSVAQRLVVADVEFKLDGSGYETVLGLKVPNTYDPVAEATKAQVRRLGGVFGRMTKAIIQ